MIVFWLVVILAGVFALAAFVVEFGGPLLYRHEPEIEPDPTENLRPHKPHVDILPRD